MEKFKFECGCEFDINGYFANGEPRIVFKPDLSSVPLTCPRTWETISEGNTLGCFQLESRLGQSLAKRLKPTCIEHLSALVSILRPGSLESMRDNKSITDHYIDRKNGVEEVTYYHPALEPILKKTYGEMIYQEQALLIAKDIAGMTLEEADSLRKSIGKKLPALMSKMKTLFIESAVKKGIVNQEQAEEIFGWIQASQRYSFNASHGCSYAMNCYLSAYAKAHFRKQFFTSYLYYAREKIKPHEEVRGLVNNAKSMNIDVYPPNITKGNMRFKLFGDKIYFGLGDIKSVGDSVVSKLTNRLNEVKSILSKDISCLSWLDLLIFLLPNITSTAVNAMISVGVLSHLRIDRTKMLFDYTKYSSLTDKERLWIQNYYLNQQDKPATLLDVLRIVQTQPVGKAGAVANKNRKLAIDNMIGELEVPPYSMEDNPSWIAKVEKEFLGISVTCSEVDGCRIIGANMTCKDFVDCKSVCDSIAIAAQVDKINEIKTKRGKNPGQLMAFVTVSDSSGQLDSIVAFPDVWDKYQGLLQEGNNVIIMGKRGDKIDSFILTGVQQI